MVAQDEHEGHPGEGGSGLGVDVPHDLDGRVDGVGHRFRVPAHRVAEKGCANDGNRWHTRVTKETHIISIFCIVFQLLHYILPE